ncbi:hypothetical protein ABGB18_48255 [Nonomuraea sp. B12E4]
MLFVHGLGGVGKTALLQRFAQHAVAAGRPVTMLDGRTLDPSPLSFEAVAGRALTDERVVLLIDAFEQIQGLESWLRGRFLPRLPDGAVVVLAGRIPPNLVWQADPGWADTLRLIALHNLAPVDSAALLRAPTPTRQVRAVTTRDSSVTSARIPVPMPPTRCSSESRVTRHERASPTGPAGAAGPGRHQSPSVPPRPFTGRLRIITGDAAGYIGPASLSVSV